MARFKMFQIAKRLPCIISKAKQTPHHACQINPMILSVLSVLSWFETKRSHDRIDF